MDKKIIFAILLISLTFVFGCTQNAKLEDKTDFKFVFYINETGERLDGMVYLNEEFLGSTQNGELIVSKDEIYPGRIYLNGTYKGEAFNFEFTLKKNDLKNYNNMNYYVAKKEIDSITMNLSSINTDKIARRIFEGINQKREAIGIEKLKWEPKLAETAKKYALELASKGWGYKHDVADRFIEDDIYFLASGYISYYTGELYSTINISSISIDDIQLTTSMKNVILDKDFDVGGAGVYCKKRECFLVVDFAQTKYDFSRELSEDFCGFSSIRWDELPIDAVKTEITVNSTGKIDVYILANKDDYTFCKLKKYIEGEDNIAFYQTTLDVKKGYGLFFYAKNKDVNISVKLKYEI